jgi:hypothetical protein
LDQWLDLLGLGLILLALLTFLSFLSTQGALTGWWLGLLQSIFGWGVFVVPLGLGAVGLWLVLRRFGEKGPQVAPEVVVGIALAFLAALGSMHLLARLFYDLELRDLAEQGVGGGYVGLLLDDLLLNAVGGWGAVVVLLALWIVAFMLALGVSVVELAQFFGRVWAWIRGRGPLRAGSQAQPDLIINTPAANSRGSKSAPSKRAARERPAGTESVPAKAEPASQPASKSAPPDALPATPATGPIYPRAHIIGDQPEWKLPVVEEIFEVGRARTERTGDS